MPGIGRASAPGKLRRNERYIHLNPCRARLIDDPLAWPWSTHRDRVGLAWPCAVPTRTDPAAFHRYVSADPSVAVDGTLLPCRLDGGTAEQVYAAVSALTRSPAERLQLRGPARTLWIQSLRLLTELTQPAIAREVGVCLSTVQRLPPRWTPEIRLVRRVLGDRRFPALDDGAAAWARRSLWSPRA